MITPIPCSRAYGMSSALAPRLSSDSGGCSESTRRIAWQRASSSTSKLQTPIQRTLPSSTSSAIVPQDSSTGVPVAWSGQWNW